MDAELAQYGLLAIVIGTMFEGELALLLGVLLASRGYLPMHGALLAAWVGAVAGDQMWFYAGRLFGHRLLAARPAFARRAVRIRAFAVRHQYTAALGMRFAYGMRTVIPFTLGFSMISRSRLLVLNCIGAAAWVGVYGWIGIALGEALSATLDRVRQHERELVLAAIAVGLTIWLVIRLRNILRERAMRRLRDRRRSTGRPLR